MIPFDKALALIADAAVPFAKETIPLDEAHGRILAEPVVAAVNSPPADMSAMDGYAVREADLESVPVRLKVASTVFAGAAELREISTGECARIFTGAPLPPGADRVVIQEVVERSGDEIRISGPPSSSRNIRKCGGDFRRGDTLLEAGRKMDYRALVAAAGADLAQVTCWQRPRVALLTTGDELIEPGRASKVSGAIPESASVGVRALIELLGGQVVHQNRLKDDLESMEAAAAEALAIADLVVVIGGASVGEKDFAKQMFAPAGLDLTFSKVAMKPGKPVWFGEANGKHVMGLPGNPTSAIVTARLLLAPLIGGLAGVNPLQVGRWRKITAGANLPSGGDRETFIRGQLDENGRAVLLSNQHSSAQHALADAEILVRREAHTPSCKTGDMVDILDL